MTLRDDDCERELYEAEAAIKRAVGLFPEVSQECLARIIGDNPEFLRVARVVGDQAQDFLAKSFGDEKKCLIGGIEWERSKPPKRTGWDTDALKSAVLDSRLVDPESGEVADESPLEKVLHVFNLPAPRLGALRDRGIEPDKFCTVAWDSQQSWKCQPSAKKRGRKKP